MKNFIKIKQNAKVVKFSCSSKKKVDMLKKKPTQTQRDWQGTFKKNLLYGIMNHWSLLCVLMQQEIYFRNLIKIL